MKNILLSLWNCNLGNYMTRRNRDVMKKNIRTKSKSIIKDGEWLERNTKR